jgi:hypothetical protein
MQEQLNLKPAHKLVKSYYETLGQLGQLNFDHEGAVRGAFQALLKGCGRQFDWELIAEYQIAKPKARPIRTFMSATNSNPNTNWSTPKKDGLTGAWRRCASAKTKPRLSTTNS